MRSREASTAFIGRLYGADALGLYTRASGCLHARWSNSSRRSMPCSCPRFPDFKRSCAYRRVFLLVYETLALIGSLFTGLLLGLAYPLTLIVLGPKWEGAASIFAGFAAVALFVPLCSACSWLMTSQGRGGIRSCRARSFRGDGRRVRCRHSVGPAAVAISYSISGLLIQIPACTTLPVGTALCGREICG